MTRWAPIIFNVVLFDVLWTMAVLGAGRPWWWAAPVPIAASAAAQLRRSPSPGVELALILIGAAAGMSLDAAACALGLFRYASGSPAEFLIVFWSLWINFGTTIRPSLRWAWRRPATLAALGAVGGPLAYWTASRIGAVMPFEPAWRMLAWCAVQYGLALPLWGVAAERLLSPPPELAHRPTGHASPRSPGTPAS